MVLLFGATLQLIGASLLATLPISTTISEAQYGYQVLLGVGLGMSISGVFLDLPGNVEKRDQSIAVGSVTQCRSLGGAIGLAITTSILNSAIRSRLSMTLSPDVVDQILRSTNVIDTLPKALQQSTREVFASEYDTQMKVVIGFTVAEFLGTLLIWRKKSATPTAVVG